MAPAPAPQPIGANLALPPMREPMPLTDIAAPAHRGVSERRPRESTAAVPGRIETPTSPTPARIEGEPFAQKPAPPAPDRAASAARVGATEVTISIGQIEVRSVPAPERQRSSTPRPRVTLEEFLRRREAAGR
jgi:hypothetical protein